MCYTQALLMDSLILNSVAHILLLLPTTDSKNMDKPGINGEVAKNNRTDTLQTGFFIYIISR